MLLVILKNWENNHFLQRVVDKVFFLISTLFLMLKNNFFLEPMGFGGFGGFCGFGGLGVRSRPQCGREEFYILKYEFNDVDYV